MISFDTPTAVRATIHNIAANQESQARWSERLATGLRINRALDDAAGLAIADTLDVRTSTAQVLRRNIATAHDVASIADGGLAEIASTLTRLRELATQSANGVYTESDRGKMDLEFQSLLSEVDRVAVSTTFDGKHLLARAGIDIAFVVDASGSMLGEIGRLKFAVGGLKQSLEDAGFDVAFALVEAGMALDGVDATATLADVDDPDFTATLNGLVTKGSLQDPWSSLLNASGAADVPGVVEPDALTWRDATRRHLVVISDTGREADVLGGGVTQLNVATALAGEGVVVDAIIRPAEAATFDKVTDLTGGEMHDIGDLTGNGIQGSLNAIANRITASQIAQNDRFEIQVGHDGVAADRLDLGLPTDATTAGLALQGAHVRSTEGAKVSMARIDAAIERLGEARARLGAVQNRLETAANVNQQGFVTDSAALSRIRDVDIAEATGRLLATRIRSEAGVALVGQAHSMQRELVLALLAP